MTYKISLGGLPLSGAPNTNRLISALAQFQARQALATSTAVTDNSGGVTSAALSIAPVISAAVDVVNASSNLADKATTEAALGTVLSAIATLTTQANARATKLGLPSLTYNGGGTDGAGTVSAVTVSVTAAATGTPSAAFNAVVANLNAALYLLAVQANHVAVASGGKKLVLTGGVNLKGSFGPVAAISTGTGNAASPAATAVSVDAVLVAFAANLATIATALNAASSGAGAPGVVVAG